jgi:uncharacterized protein
VEKMTFTIENIKNIVKKDENRIMIIGMPGIGNAGKLSVDYIIEILKFEKIAIFETKRMPVFSYIDMSDKMKLPELAVYQKKISENRVFILSGDFQPLNEEDMFLFSNSVLEYCKTNKIKEVICTGGIGLPLLPDEPEIYAASATIIPKNVVKAGAKIKIHGHIASIAGITGLLPVLAQKHKIKSYAILVETIAFPDSISLKSARNLILFLNKLIPLKINLKRLDTEMKDTSKISELEKVHHGGAMKDETSYIG